ncbi:MAG TPA: TIM barrel protein [Microvirga sp.]|jgi:hydroxypyruvate isomerase|nr:TIM barrel protein [Microvirga sp.]
MPRFSANLGFLFADRPDIARVEAAAAAGFRAVEMHWPYGTPAAEMRAALQRCDVAMLGLNTVVGRDGESGLGALPGREAEFRQAVEQAVAYGQAIGATAVHCMAGVVTPDRLDTAERVFVENLRIASDIVGQAGMTVLIEPLNHRDKPDYALFRIEQAASIIGRTGRGNVKIMFDCYHVQIMQGDLIRRFEAHRELVGHVQIAAVPSRAEPDEGELNFPEICRAFERLGYDGWIGAEYKPRGRTEDGLGWLKAWSDPNSLQARN